VARGGPQQQLLAGGGGGAPKGSPQEQWLKADLSAHPAACTLAYRHAPRFSSRSGLILKPFWNDLYNAGTDVVLNGHRHNYERFAPQTPDGVADSAKGIREFVVGTGGEKLTAFKGIRANSEVRNGGTFGAFQLTLHAGNYDWTFVPVAGQSFTDSDTTSCH
jgi:hypothetical protein